MEMINIVKTEIMMPNNSYTGDDTNDNDNINDAYMTNIRLMMPLTNISFKVQQATFFFQKPSPCREFPRVKYSDLCNGV